MSTKTNWKILPYNNWDKVIEIDAGVTLDYDDVDHHEVEKNAKLIVKAVNNHEALIDALQEAHRVIFLHEDGIITRHHSIEIRNKIRAVLKQAQKG